MEVTESECCMVYNLGSSMGIALKLSGIVNSLVVKNCPSWGSFEVGLDHLDELVRVSCQY